MKQKVPFFISQSISSSRLIYPLRGQGQSARTFHSHGLRITRVVTIFGAKHVFLLIILVFSSILNLIFK
jgi:hypothetical protein